MINQILKLLNSKKILNDNLNAYKEAFIMFYGEDCREEIEYKFKNALYLTYYSPETVRSYILDYKDIKYKEKLKSLFSSTKIDVLKDKLLSDIPEEITELHKMGIVQFKLFYDLFKLPEEERKKLLTKKYIKELKTMIPDFTEEDYNNIMSTKQIPDKYNKPENLIYLSFYMNPNSFRKSLEFKFNSASNTLLKDLGLNCTLDEFENNLDNPIIEDLIRICDEIKIIHDEYKNNKVDESVQNFMEDAEYSKKKREIENKYYKILLKAGLDLIPKEKIDNVERFIEQENNLDNVVKKILGKSLTDDYLLINAFSTKGEEKLTSEVEEWVKERIKIERIKYFQMLGFDLGNDYENYINNPEIQRIWPDKDRVDKFIKLKIQLIDNYYEEYYTNSPNHKKIVNEIQKYDFLAKGLPTHELYTGRGAARISANVIKYNGLYKLFPILLIGLDKDESSLDHYIIHELNHLFELFLIYADENGYEMLCGWDIFKTSTEDDEDEKSNKRKYEYFNEIINETIAKEITNLMHNNKMFIFYDENNTSTGYDDMYLFTEEFYNEFKEDIIKSRRNGKIQIIWDKVGKDNFDELNDIIREYKDKIKNHIIPITTRIKSGEDSEETRLFNKLIQGKDEVLNKMREYALNNKTDTNKKR